MEGCLLVVIVVVCLCVFFLEPPSSAYSFQLSSCNPHPTQERATEKQHLSAREGSGKKKKKKGERKKKKVRNATSKRRALSSVVSKQQHSPAPRPSGSPTLPETDRLTDRQHPPTPRLPPARLCYIFRSFVRACPFSGVIGFTAEGWM